MFFEYLLFWVLSFVGREWVLVSCCLYLGFVIFVVEKVYESYLFVIKKGIRG